MENTEKWLMNPESREEVKVILETFNGQITWSRFLKSKWLLTREPDPKEIDIIVPSNTFDLTKRYLKAKGRTPRTKEGKYRGIIELDTFEQWWYVIDVFMDDKEVTVPSVLNTKLKLITSLDSSSNMDKQQVQKHKDDLQECLSNLRPKNL